jgi:hypothetical protein
MTTTPTVPPTLVPHLSTLNAPPIPTTLLALTRPVKHVTTHNHTNLDTGLRPSALVAAIEGITSLDVWFDANVDKRSVEKVLRAAARVLGAGCERLDVEIGVIVSPEVHFLSSFHMDLFFVHDENVVSTKSFISLVTTLFYRPSHAHSTTSHNNASTDSTRHSPSTPLQSSCSLAYTAPIDLKHHLLHVLHIIFDP